MNRVPESPHFFYATPLSDLSGFTDFPSLSFPPEDQLQTSFSPQDISPSSPRFYRGFSFKEPFLLKPFFLNLASLLFFDGSIACPLE